MPSQSCPEQLPQHTHDLLTEKNLFLLCRWMFEHPNCGQVEPHSHCRHKAGVAHLARTPLQTAIKNCVSQPHPWPRNLCQHKLRCLRRHCDNPLMNDDAVTILMHGAASRQAHATAHHLSAYLPHTLLISGFQTAENPRSNSNCVRMTMI